MIGNKRTARATMKWGLLTIAFAMVVLVLNFSQSTTKVAAEDPPGSALDFDGTDDFVTASNAPELNFGTGDFTAELWVNYESTVGESVLIEKCNGVCGSNGWTLTRLSNDVLRLHGANGPIDSDPLSIPTGVWHHFAVVRSAGVATIYHDGSVVASGAASADVSTSFILHLGRRNPAGQGFFHTGLIDEVRVWNVARSQAQIQAAMNSCLTGTEAGLVLYWPLDEGSGQVPGDSSGNGNDGQLGSSASADASDPAWIAPDAVTCTKEPTLPPDEQINIHVNRLATGAKLEGTCWRVSYGPAKVQHDVVGDDTAGVKPDCGEPSNLKLFDEDPLPGNLRITITSAQRVQFGDIWHVQHSFSPDGNLDPNNFECDLSDGKCTLPKVAVGGLSVDLASDETGLPLETAQSTGGSAGMVLVAAISAVAIAVTGAAWYARRRWLG